MERLEKLIITMTEAPPAPPIPPVPTFHLLSVPMDPGAGLQVLVLLRQGAAEHVLHHHQDHALQRRGEEDEAGDGGLVKRKLLQIYY